MPRTGTMIIACKMVNLAPGRRPPALDGTAGSSTGVIRGRRSRSPVAFSIDHPPFDSIASAAHSWCFTVAGFAAHRLHSDFRRTLLPFVSTSMRVLDQGLVCESDVAMITE